MTFTAENIFFLGAVLIFFSGGIETIRRDIELVASQGLMLSTVGVLTRLFHHLSLFVCVAYLLQHLRRPFFGSGQ